MLAFLITAIVIGGVIFYAFRFSMHLYTRGAFAQPSPSVSSIVERLPIVPVVEYSEIEQDYGMRYARSALLLIVGIASVVVVGVIVALLLVLH